MELTNSTAIPSATPMSALITMFYEPTKTFEQLEGRPRSWFPTLVLILTSLIAFAWYFAIVDYPWLIDQMTASLKTVEEKEVFAKVMSKTMLAVSTIGSVVVIYPVTFALSGVYLMIVSKMLNTGFSFGKGYALAAWSAIPTILYLPLAALQIVLHPEGQFDFSALNPVSFNQLFFNYEMGHPLASFMDTLSLTMFWGMFLSVIGFEVWAKVKRSTAIAVVALPYVVIFGVWFALATSA